MLNHLKNAPVRVSDMPPDALRRYCAQRHEQHREEWLRGRERPTVVERVAAFLFPNPHSPGRTAPAAHSTLPTPSGRASANHRVR